MGKTASFMCENMYYTFIDKNKLCTKMFHIALDEAYATCIMVEMLPAALIVLF